MPENDNIKVAVRVRPQNLKERDEFSGKKCIDVDISSSTITLDSKPNHKTFTYDFVGDQNISQEEIFEVIGKPIASSCLAGYNGTIFAYGQTGAGKTYTILGPSASENNEVADNVQLGLLPRSIEFIFSSVKKEVKKCAGLEFLIKCSFLEIYNEQINDLINPDLKSLQIREDTKKGVYVEGLLLETVSNVEETMELLLRGTRNRHVGATSMNKESSRSHSVFSLAIESKEKKENVWNFRSSVFHLIDLAGSERQKSTEAAGERLKEAGMINKSLSVLGNVINSLVDISEGKNRHVHYRDSKLTYLLKDSLGGNSKTCIIANISSSNSSYGETLSTLRFAERAKMVKNQAIVNENTLGTINELREEIKRLHFKLKESKFSSCQKCTNPQIYSEYTLMALNDRVQEFENLLERNLKLRLQTESGLQSEIGNRENYIRQLLSTIDRFEKKIESDKMIIKFRQDNITRLQKGEKISDNEEIKELKLEMSVLKKECENNYMASKFFCENEALKEHIKTLEREIKEDSTSLRRRLKENQEFTEKLQNSLKKSANEREQLRALLNQYISLKGSEISTQVQDLSQTLDFYLDLEKESPTLKENETMLMDFDNYKFEENFSNNFDPSPKENILTPSFKDNLPCSKPNNSQDKIYQKFIGEIEVLNEEIDNKVENIRTLENQVNKKKSEIEEIRKENMGLKEIEKQFILIEDDLLKAKDSLD